MKDYIVISLNELLEEESIDEDIISKSFEKFSCNREKDLEEFLHRKAIVYERADVGRTYLLLDKDKLNEELSIIAFFKMV